MSNLGIAIAVAGIFISIGIYCGLQAIAYSFDRLWRLMHDMHIDVNHYNRTANESEANNEH